MSLLFHRPPAASCFFCQSAITPAPPNPRSFRCPHCTCWNRYDARGEILSDEPAMHEEALNARSFARRASPRKDRLLETYTSNTFCHTCRTNQTLLMNLLSNYLPSPDDPEYAQRAAALPAYRASLHVRYPPVCAACRPAVEDEIRRKDHMARTRALGGWLRESKGKKRMASGQGAGTGKMREGRVGAWRVRGALWAGSLLMALAGDGMGALGHDIRAPLLRVQPALPAIAFISILWAAWDPTYASYCKARTQGRDVRVQGKKQYIILQMTAWLSRVITSLQLTMSWLRPETWDYLHLKDPTFIRSRMYFSLMFFLELSIFIISCFTLRLRHPPPVRLIDTKTHEFATGAGSSPSHPRSHSEPPPVAEADLLSSLSLSSKPILAAHNPMFGVPSLAGQPAGPSLSLPTPPPSTSPLERMDEDDEDGGRGDDRMDWSPSAPDPSAGWQQQQSAPRDEGAWLRRQTFFPPEQPTGLEGLLARARLADDAGRAPAHSLALWRRAGTRWVLAFVLLPLAVGAAAFAVWRWRYRQAGLGPDEEEVRTWRRAFVSP